MHQYRLGADHWRGEGAECSGEQVGHEPAVCPCGQEDQYYSGCIKRSVASRSREVILLCFVVVRLYLE